MALTYPLPAALNGVALEAELATAGHRASVTVDRDTLVVDGPADSVSDAVAAVIAAHKPPTPTNPAADFRSAVDAVDTSKITDAGTRAAINALKAALVGSAGPGVQPRAR